MTYSSLGDLALKKSIDLGSTALPAASSAIRSSVDDLLKLAQGATSYNPAPAVQETVERVVKKPNAFLEQFLGPLGSNLAKGAAFGIPAVAGLAVAPYVLKGLAPLWGLGGKEGDEQSGGQSGQFNQLSQFAFNHTVIQDPAILYIPTLL